MSADSVGLPTRYRVRQILRSQFVLFLLVGGTAAAVNFLSRMVINRWTTYLVAVIVAFCFGVITAFVLNRLFVFKGSNRSIHHQMTWFLLVNLFGLVQTVAVSVLLAQYVFPTNNFRWHADSVAHIIGILVPLISSYFGHKYLSFRH